MPVIHPVILIPLTPSFLAFQKENFVCILRYLLTSNVRVFKFQDNKQSEKRKWRPLYTEWLISSTMRAYFRGPNEKIWIQIEAMRRCVCVYSCTYSPDPRWMF